MRSVARAIAAIDRGAFLSDRDLHVRLMNVLEDRFDTVDLVAPEAVAEACMSLPCSQVLAMS